MIGFSNRNHIEKMQFFIWAIISVIMSMTGGKVFLKVPIYTNQAAKTKNTRKEREWFFLHHLTLLCLPPNNYDVPFDFTKMVQWL